MLNRVMLQEGPITPNDFEELVLRLHEIQVPAHAAHHACEQLPSVQILNRPCVQCRPSSSAALS